MEGSAAVHAIHANRRVGILARIYQALSTVEVAPSQETAADKTGTGVSGVFAGFRLLTSCDIQKINIMAVRHILQQFDYTLYSLQPGQTNLSILSAWDFLIPRQAA